MNLEEICDNYKKINIYKIYYKEKNYKRVIIFLMMVIAMLLFMAIVLVPKKIIVVMYILPLTAVILIIIGIKMMGHIDIEVSQKIKEQLNIKYNYTNAYSYFSVAKSKEFIEYLDKVGIKSVRQKELLAKLLYQKYNETKVNNIWIIGVLAALFLPMWNKIIDIQLPKYMNSGKAFLSYFESVCIIAALIIVVVGYIRFILNSTILDFINTESNRYKSMYYSLQFYIMSTKSSDMYKGEITLVKKQ